jgi:GNAT superfamily N-acetyltransferase
VSIDVTVRVGELDDESHVIEHFYKMWRDIGVQANDMNTDWRTTVQEFMQRASAEQQYRFFVAEGTSGVVGSAGCHLWPSPYPDVLISTSGKVGYVWGVYVEPGCRGLGIAQKLVAEALLYLEKIGCKRALLHASDSGRFVYDRLGFINSDEMGIDLGSVEKQTDR